MSAHQAINDVHFLPAVEVGERFNYSKDYILLLLKQGKIDGKKVANRWYANVASAEKFFEEAKKQKEVRREKIRSERKQELQARQILQPVARVVESPVRVQHPTQAVKRYAVLETFAIVVIGVLIGTTGYVWTSVDMRMAETYEGGTLEQFALALYGFVSGSSQTAHTLGVPPHIESQGVSGTYAGTTENDDAHSDTHSLVIMKADDTSPETIDQIRESFSDPVDVQIDEESPDTGIITPKFKNREGEEYRFLMVPITSDASQSKNTDS
jgi:hypothetical protein